MSARLVRAFARLHWRLLVNGLKGGANRGTVEQASRWFAVAAPVLLGLLLTPLALALLAGGVFCGWSLARSEENAMPVVLVLGFLLVLPTVWVLIRPLLPNDRTAWERSDLLRILPIPRAFLARAAVVGAASDPLLAMLAPALLLLPAGALAAGRVWLAAFDLAAGVAFLTFLFAVAALVSLLVQLLLRDRRRGELVTLVFFLTLSTAGIVPQLFVRDAPPAGRRSAPTARAARGPRPTPRSSPDTMPVAFRLLPSGAYSTSLAAAAAGRWLEATAGVGALALLAGAALAAVGPIHRHLTETPGRGESIRVRSGARTRLRLPFVAPVTLAVAITQWRLVIRTVRGRMMLIGTPVTALLLAVIMSRPAGPASTMLGAPTFLVGFIILMAITSTAVVAGNQFAASGPGLVFELVQAVPVRSMVRGRALAHGSLAAAVLVVCVLPLTLLLRGIPLAVWVALVLGGGAALAALQPVLAIVAALLPRSVNLGKLGKDGNPHPLASLATLLVSLLVGAPVAGAVFVAVAVMREPWLAAAFAAVWLVVVALAAAACMPLAERVAARQRENLGLVAVWR